MIFPVVMYGCESWTIKKAECQRLCQTPLNCGAGLISLLQHYSLKASVLWRSAFFMVQLSQPYLTTGNTIALTIQTIVGRVIFLPFNTLSRFVMALLPRSNHLLISWLQSPSAVVLEPKKRASTFSLSLCHEVMGPDNSLQCSCLENPRDGGAWWAAVSGVVQSQTSVSSYPSAFFMVQLSQPYMTIRKTIALTI